MNIDKTLRRIVLTAICTPDAGTITTVQKLLDDSVAAIHQAYKDAGYIKVTIHSTKATTTFSLPVYMSGSEWMERFTEELRSSQLGHVLKGYEPEDVQAVFTIVEEVAKAASDVKEDTK